MTTRMSTAGMYIVLNVQFCKNRDAVRVFPKYVQYPDPVSLQYIQCCGSKLSNSIRIRIRDILHGYNLQLPVNINLKKDFKKWSKSYKKNNACEESSEFLSLSHVSFFNGNNTAYFYLKKTVKLVISLVFLAPTVPVCIVDRKLFLFIFIHSRVLASRNDLGQYDFAIDVVTGGRKAPKESQSTAKQLSALSTALEGFSIATTKSSIKKHFEAPVVPRDWRPSRTPLARKSRFEPAQEVSGTSAASASLPQGPANTNPTREQRRAVLFPDEANQLLARGKEDVPAVEETKLPDFLLAESQPAGDQQTPVGAFRPFANNADKQKRYDQYLACLRNGRKDALKLLQPKAMTEWERERERVEFERAALLYQPMKAVISSRFVSAGSAEDETSKSGELFCAEFFSIGQFFNPSFVTVFD